MKKVMITGASSAIGRRLAERFLRAQWQVTAVVRSRERAECLPDGVRTVICGMQDYAGLGRHAAGFDCFLHLAWDGTRGNARMDAQLQQRNLRFSMDAVESVVANGCRRVVLAGSQAEYGPQSGVIAEETPCAPACEYGRAKLELGRFAARLCKNAHVSFREVRIFSLYGPDDLPGTMVMQTLVNMIAGRECLLTRGIQMWDFLYIDDAVEAIYRLCDMDCRDGVYNLGSGDIRTLRAYIEEMAVVADTRSPLRFGAVEYPATGMVSLRPDTARIRRETGWTPRVRFADGIKNILQTMNGEKIQ